jgi:AcrR family transcriptional regulator
VEAILVATARLLPDHGVDRATTNQIAELAGVSIGSLYQYFPNKDSIFARLIERELSANEDAVLARARAVRDGPLDEVVGAVVDTSVDRLLDHGAILRELMQQAHRLERIPAIVASRARVNEKLAATLAGHPEIAPGRDLLAAAEICVSALIGVLQQLVLERRESVGRRERERIKTELTTMFVAYLKSAPR